MIPFKHFLTAIFLSIPLAVLAACQSDATDQIEPHVLTETPTVTQPVSSTLPPTWTPIPTETPVSTSTPLPRATRTPIPSTTPEAASESVSSASMLFASNLIPSQDTYGVFTGQYGAIAKSFQSSEQWDITACDLTITYTLDMSENTRPGGIIVGVTDGAQGWMHASAAEAIQTDDTRYDRDDRLLLESPDHVGEASYNVLNEYRFVAPPLGDPQISYGIWFDRDGVAPEEATAWGAIDGATYNTGGVYTVSITYHAFDNFSGAMVATVNGVQTGFYDLKHDGPPEHYPVGKLFRGEHVYAVRVFANVDALQTTIIDLSVTGCLHRRYVRIDLLPDDESNCISNSGTEPIPVAILGSRTFNVDEIALNTLIFEGLSPVLSDSQPQAYATYVNDDPYADLLVHFERAGKTWSADQDYVGLEAELRDFTPFEGSDSLCIE